MTQYGVPGIPTRIAVPLKRYVSAIQHISFSEIQNYNLRREKWKQYLKQEI
jgi:hypothetical protein